MRALTIRQPFAWAIAAGHKAVENRSWSTSYRGPLAIHAGLRQDVEAMQDHRVMAATHGWVVEHWPREDRPWHTVGAIVAVAELVDVHPATGCCKPWGVGIYNCRQAKHLVLADIRPLAEPVPCKGSLGVWTVPDEVASQILAAA